MLLTKERGSGPDRPALAGFAEIAGLDRRLRAEVPGADVEALAVQIGNPSVNERPILCGSPVAINQLDGGSIRRSTP